MLTGIDHLILAVPDPDRAADDVERVLGLAAGGGGRHDAHGTHNRLIWLGDSYVELMGIFDGRLAAGSWWGAHIVDVLANRPDGGQAGLVLASDDLDADADRMRSAGASIGQPEAGERVRPDGRVVRWRAAMPPLPDPDLGLAFLIEHDTTAAEWTPAERTERAAAVHPMGTAVALSRVELPVGDMHRATMRVHRELGVAFRPSLAGGGARDGAIGRQTLRLLRAGPGVPARPARLVLRGGDRRREQALLGCSWLIEPGA